MYYNMQTLTIFLYDIFCRQEGIVKGASYCYYTRIEVEVVGEGREEVMVCRSYEITDQSPHLEGLPSPQYLQVITRGAEEVGLPRDYQQMLREHPHNHYEGEVAIFTAINEARPPYNMAEKTFLYFGYASNMNKKRINVSCPSAELVCAARLDGYGLKFVTFRGVESRWCGAVACAVEQQGESLWGAVWRIKNEDGPSLDK